MQKSPLTNIQHIMLKLVDRSCTYLHTIKTVYNNPIPNIKFNEKKHKEIQLKSGARQVCALSPYLFNILPECLARAISQLEEIM